MKRDGNIPQHCGKAYCVKPPVWRVVYYKGVSATHKVEFCCAPHCIELIGKREWTEAEKIE